MKKIAITAAVLAGIPLGAWAFREILRIPRHKIGLPIAPEVHQGKLQKTLGQKLYWQFIGTTGMNSELHRDIAQTGDLKPGEYVLDIGSGTGELALLLKTVVGAEGRVAGIDLNENFLERCRRRSERFQLPVDFRKGNAADIPFPDNEFDAVTCSLMAHHLPTEIKIAMFSEILRVLRPGGRMIFFDLTRPQTFNEWFQVLGLLSLDLLFEWHCASINLRGQLPGMIEAAGFNIVNKRFRHMLGVRTQFIIGNKPA